MGQDKALSTALEVLTLDHSNNEPEENVITFPEKTTWFDVNMYSLACCRLE